MGIFTDIENYLKGLCEDHPLVRHDAVISGSKKRKSFFRCNEEWELIEATQEEISYPCVCFQSIRGRLKDEDNAMAVISRIWSNAWLFIDKKTGKTGGADEVQAIYDSTFQIMNDFILTMKEDYEENGSCGAFKKFDLNKIYFAQTGQVFENAYGWIMYFDDEFKATDLE